jgi:hypothetical protein
VVGVSDKICKEMRFAIVVKVNEKMKNHEDER